MLSEIVYFFKSSSVLVPEICMCFVFVKVLLLLLRLTINKHSQIEKTNHWRLIFYAGCKVIT